jgi:hypothetical protein
MSNRRTQFPREVFLQELNTPKEIGHAARMYSAIPATGQGPQNILFHVVRRPKNAWLQFVYSPHWRNCAYCQDSWDWVAVLVM